MTCQDRRIGYALLIWKAKNFGFEKATAEPTLSDMDRLVADQTTRHVSLHVRQDMLREARYVWRQRAIPPSNPPDPPKRDDTEVG